MTPFSVHSNGGIFIIHVGLSLRPLPPLPLPLVPNCGTFGASFILKRVYRRHLRGLDTDTPVVAIVIALYKILNYIHISTGCCEP